MHNLHALHSYTKATYTIRFTIDDEEEEMGSTSKHIGVKDARGAYAGCGSGSHTTSGNCESRNLCEVDSLANALRSTDHKSLVSQFVFGDKGSAGKFRGIIAARGLRPVWLEGDAEAGGRVYSVQSFSLKGLQCHPVTLNGHPIGYVYEDEHARYCRLSGVAAANRASSREAQTQEVFERISEALGSCGFAFTDTVRTWFYLDRLLEWYKEFNTVRTAFFEKVGMFDKLVPASTGIGAANSLGSALIADALAVQPKKATTTIQAVASPLQGSALSYRSSFSRAVELSFPTHRSLLISGSASIDKEGKSVHIGDVAKQIELTLQVVDALLESRGMTWSDVSRSIAYFKNFGDVELFGTIRRHLNLPPFPMAMAQTDICRHDLLFELEADAVTPTI